MSLSFFVLVLLNKNKSKLKDILFYLSVLTSIIYLFINPIFENYNLTTGSTVPILLFVLQLLIAIRLPLNKRNSFFGVKTPLALNNDEVWREVNDMGSSCTYLTLYPLFITIFYFDDTSKIILSFLITLLGCVIIIIKALSIERICRKEILKKEEIELSKQRKIESGG